MASHGKIGKECTCKDPDTGKPIGRTCPQLRRKGGGWSASHGVWYLQLELPARTATGRRQFRRSGFTRSDDAQAVLDDARALLALAPKDTELTLRIADLLHNLGRGKPLPTPKDVLRKLRAGYVNGAELTLADYLDDWLTNRRGLAPGSVAAYESHIRIHLKPHLGHIGLASLIPVHIQDMFTAIDTANQNLQQAQSSSDPAVRASVLGRQFTGPATQGRIRATLRKALEDAIRVYKLIDSNAAKAIDMPSGQRPRPRVWTTKAVDVWRDTGTIPSPVMVWRPATASEFLDYAEAHDIMFYALFSLVAVWGLRRGEACGLRDIDVDLTNNIITVTRQRVAVRYQTIEREVKTRAGERILPIDNHTSAILTDYLAMRDTWQQVAGDDWPATGLFFVKPDGTPWHPELVSERFVKLIAAAGLPPIRLHDLRHCAASYLKLAGADMKTIQETLGHSSIVITSDTYTSLFADLDRTVTDGAANIIHLNRHTTRLTSITTKLKATRPSKRKAA
jgi:integrase